MEDEAQVMAIFAKAIAISDYTVYDEAVLRKAYVKLNGAIGTRTELPPGTLAALRRIRCAIKAIDDRMPSQTGKLLQMRVEVPSTPALVAPVPSVSGLTQVAIPQLPDRVSLMTSESYERAITDFIRTYVPPDAD